VNTRSSEIERIWQYLKHSTTANTQMDWSNFGKKIIIAM